MPQITRQQRVEVRKKVFAYLKKVEAASAYVPLDDKSRTDVDTIASGSLVIDKILGCGGWPRGRVVEIFGPESVGKTTVAIAACIEAQREGGFATYIDFEHALHLGYAQAMGLDISEDAFAFFQPDYFEMGANIAYAYTKVMQSDIIVIDSVSAMIPKAVFEGSPDEGSKGLGLQARLMANFLNQITKELPKTGTTLLFINQMRSNIKISKYDPGPDWTTSGGKSLPYYCTIRLRLKPGKVEYANIEDELTGEKDKIPVSNFVRAEGHKNKVGFPKRKGEFVIRYGEGIDNCRSIIDVAERYKIIKKSGAWYEYKSQGEVGWLKRQGIEQFRKSLLEKPEIFQLLATEVSDKLASFQINKIKQTFDDSELISEDRSNMDFSDDESENASNDEDFDINELMDDDAPPSNSSSSSDDLLSFEDIEDIAG